MTNNRTTTTTRKMRRPMLRNKEPRMKMTALANVILDDGVMSTGCKEANATLADGRIAVGRCRTSPIQEPSTTL